MNPFVPREKALTSDMMGLDFIAFYTAGSFVRSGHAADLYNISAVFDFEKRVAANEHLDLHRVGPWWNPPFYALVFAPLSTLSFKAARAVWITIDVAALAAALCILVRMLPRCHWQSWALLPLLTLVSMPTIQSLSHGQNTPVSLLILSIVVALWRSARSGAPANDSSVADPSNLQRRASDTPRKFLTGIAAGLLFYKPQLAAVLAAALVADLGLPALLGLAAAGAVLLAINLIALPGTLSNYLHQLPLNVRFMQIQNPYLWERHVTLKAFWRLLLQGQGAGEPHRIVSVLTLLSTSALAAFLAAAAWCVWRSRRHLSSSSTSLAPAASCLPSPFQRDRFIAATIAATPLLMPFYFDYDLLLLTVPATLFAAETLSRGPSAPRSRFVVRTWIALYVALLVNPALGTQTRVNAAVILLSALAIMLIQRALQYNAAQVASPRHAPSPLRAAA
jgi:hypothetical protein